MYTKNKCKVSFALFLYIHPIFSRYLIGAGAGAYIAKLIAEEELNPLDIGSYLVRHDVCLIAMNSFESSK